MARVVITSVRRNSGKTSLVVGMAKALGKPFGYMKPLGDRLMYKKKQLWDHDSALLVSLFGLKEEAQDITIGFEQAKLRYMYDQQGIADKMNAMATKLEEGREVLFVESGKDFSYGCSVFMDPIGMAKTLGAKMVCVINGDENLVLDDAAILKKFLEVYDVELAGVIVNKIPNLDDFNESTLPELRNIGVPVMGAIPFNAELTSLTVSRVAEKLMPKVLSGESRLGNKVQNVFVGAMSADAAMRNPLFQKENKLIITAGDRTDMLLLAIEGEASAVILTNNILPPPNIISKFNEKKIPLLLTAKDTYAVAMSVNHMQPLLTTEDPEKVIILEEMVKQHIEMDKLFG